MSMTELAEDAHRIKNELDHRHRMRESTERQKTHMARNIKDAQQVLDQAMQVARRAQDEVTKAQEKFDDEVSRLRRIDETIKKIAEEELELSAQLRDLTQRITREADGQGNKSSSDDGAKSFKTYR